MDADSSAATQAADADLVKAVAAGDQAAFAALYDRYCRQAYSLARRVCVDPEFAEEAVQEAFLAVWREPGRFDPARGGFAGWLLTLVHHRSVDVVRRQANHRKRNLFGDELIDEATPATGGADEKAIGGVVSGLVRDALRQLSADQRQVIGLAYLGGYTQAEVSSITGLPLGTVKSRTFAGIKRLRHLLAALTVGHDDNEGWEVQ
ncbi:RNA polymerase sigma factor [Kutzneria buriramensis]|uniref:RNA polymerase sigma-70 factor (ECF subfamily) n=1 Tax=Kutzneria buriramensis TaxID=1045776 RepID=A0A3E0GZZ9_9PSEU|nr:sigma-70 family RNA polymerase sigma factor [Kutzneria buriramensis]REH35642.1 RNA polymerase sigma-70 factor (ECF subfamily) [Kutzneria buriramensis]